jgi:hypothetical protein
MSAFFERENYLRTFSALAALRGADESQLNLRGNTICD